MPDESEDQTIYKVVVNHEEQYSIWAANMENALGWKTPARVARKMNAWPTSSKCGRTCGPSACGERWKSKGWGSRSTRLPAAPPAMLSLVSHPAECPDPEPCNQEDRFSAGSGDFDGFFTPVVLEWS
jgi:hypothetical protein